MTNFWPLDPDVVFLNHGSFGSCPRPVLAHQSALRDRLEREPVRFFLLDLEPLLDEARRAVAALIGAEPEDVAFVTNATTGVASVLASLSFQPGDRVVITSHGYNAVNNAARRAAEKSGAEVVVAEVPFPIADADQVIDAVLAALDERTRLLIVDHVTSPTGLVLPVREICEAASALGIDVLVDGAHGPGMVPLSMGRLGATFYTGNLHKWVCAPKSAGFLWVRRDKQSGIHPAVTSHGASSARSDRSRFLTEFDWTGTHDPSAILSVPKALETISALSERGLQGVMEDNRALALAARKLLCDGLGIAPPAPEGMIGALAALPLPDGSMSGPHNPLAFGDPLQEALVERHRVQVPVFPFPHRPKRLLRISAQRYNHLSQYERLLEALRAELGTGR